MTTRRIRAEKPEPSYWTLPHRGQILMLALVRFTEPIAFSSVAPYLYYMVQSFGYTQPSTISALGTLVMVSFAAGQALSSVWWGRFSDTFGRKPTLFLGVSGTLLSGLMLGLSRNVYLAVTARVIMGLLNGNVGVLRTMVAELIGPNRREYQTRAFAIMPITNNIGMIVGPMIGGMLADPVKTYPGLFGSSKLFAKFPYLLPNLVLTPLLLTSIFIVVFFVQETHTGSRVLFPVHKDKGLELGAYMKGCFKGTHEYESLDHHDDEEDEDEAEDEEEEAAGETATTEYKGLRSILTKRVRITLLCHSMLMLHAPAFMQLFPLFLSTPRMENSHQNFLMFNGGLSLPTSTIGAILSALGGLGIFLQLVVYPRAAEWFGNAGIHRFALVFFPVVYFAIPYLSFIPEQWSWWLVLAVCGATSSIAILARTFAMPPMGVLVTNAAPSYEVMGTLQGLNTSFTSLARCIGPFVFGNLYSLGVKYNMISLTWWAMVVVVVVENFVASGLRDWGEEEENGEVVEDNE